MSCQVEDLSLGQLADFDGTMEMVSRHDLCASGGADAEEGFEGALRFSSAIEELDGGDRLCEIAYPYETVFRKINS